MQVGWDGFPLFPLSQQLCYAQRLGRVAEQAPKACTATLPASRDTDVVQPAKGHVEIVPSGSVLKGENVSGLSYLLLRGPIRIVRTEPSVLDPGCLWKAPVT